MLLRTRTSPATISAELWAVSASQPGHRDGTQYGTNRGSPRSFGPHHMAQISASIVYADSETLIAHADGTMGA